MVLPHVVPLSELVPPQGNQQAVGETAWGYAKELRSQNALLGFSLDPPWVTFPWTLLRNENGRSASW